MWLQSLRLLNFRNYASLGIELDEGVNLFVGPNGSGKTSILEAVSYLAVARSLRGSRDADVVRWNQGGFGVRGDIREGETARSIVLRYTREGGKEVQVDGEEMPRLSGLVGILKAAWFGPDDIGITKGGPAGRRKLLDVILCQLDPSYLGALARYRGALRQRNEALLTWSPGEEPERALEVWTEKLAAHGGEVVSARLAFVPKLEEAVSACQALVAGHDVLRLSYRSATGYKGGEGPAEAASALLESLTRLCDAEKRSGTTMAGPHRDDLEVTLNGRPLRPYASQGQHRTAAIALKLGEAGLLGSAGAVVLLDDILSELDETRAGALVELAGTYGQALVTSTDQRPDALMARGRCTIYRVESGEVVRE